MEAQICKKFWVENSTSLLYLYSWILENLYKTCCVNLFLLKWKASFLQNKNWLHVQDFVYKTLQLVRISLLIHNKEFYVFS